jgi:hypothetical protein
VAIQIDYSFDNLSNHPFFSDPSRRAILQAAANSIGSELNGNNDGLNAVKFDFADGYGVVTDPDTGIYPSVANVDGTIPANTIDIYAGGYSMSGNLLGEGGPGGYQPPTTGGLYVLPRPWGGFVSFNSSANWYFNTSASGLIPGLADFYSVALHEIGHVLGIGILTQNSAPTPWAQQLANNTFNGPAATAWYGGPVPVQLDDPGTSTNEYGMHFAQSVDDPVTGQQDAMTPDLDTAAGMRKVFTGLDYATLSDLGWQVDPRAAFLNWPATLIETAAVGNTAYGLQSDGTLIQVNSWSRSVMDSDVESFYVNPVYGRVLALHRDGGLFVDEPSGNILLNSNVTSYSISPDGNIAYFLDQSGRLWVNGKFWTRSFSDPSLQIVYNRPITSYAMSADGQTIYAL